MRRANRQGGRRQPDEASLPAIQTEPLPACSGTPGSIAQSPIMARRRRFLWPSAQHDPPVTGAPDARLSIAGAFHSMVVLHNPIGRQGRFDNHPQRQDDWDKQAGRRTFQTRFSG